MASDEEFVRQNEELVDLRFALRRADSELELLRRERNLLRKELVMREAEIERTIALVERTDMIARLEAAETLAEERLDRLESLEARIGTFVEVDAGPDETGIHTPDEEVDAEPIPADAMALPPTDLPPGARMPAGSVDPNGADQRQAAKKRSRFRADLRQARRTSLP